MLFHNAQFIGRKALIVGGTQTWNKPLSATEYVQANSGSWFAAEVHSSNYSVVGCDCLR